jgi:hypothetical protein
MEKFATTPEQLIGNTQSVSREVLKGMKQTAIRHLNRRLPEECMMGKGGYYLSNHGEELLRYMGELIGSLSRSSNIMRLPDYKEEREALTRTILDYVINPNETILFFTPVCPDYQRSSQYSPRLIGDGISSEANAGIKVNHLIKKIFPDARTPSLILVADTEYDNRDILNTCANGNKEFYSQQCLYSAQKIKDRLLEESYIDVVTFSDYFGDSFHERQHAFEDRIDDSRKGDNKLQLQLSKISETRRERHANILGRQERGEELAIRYMAQYAALGSLMREKTSSSIAINYSSPNKEYYNLATHSGVHFSPVDTLIIPVIGSFI